MIRLIWPSAWLFLQPVHSNVAKRTSLTTNNTKAPQRDSVKTLLCCLEHHFKGSDEPMAVPSYSFLEKLPAAIAGSLKRSGAEHKILNPIVFALSALQTDAEC